MGNRLSTARRKLAELKRKQKENRGKRQSDDKDAIIQKKNASTKRILKRAKKSLSKRIRKRRAQNKVSKVKAKYLKIDDSVLEVKDKCVFENDSISDTEFEEVTVINEEFKEAVQETPEESSSEATSLAEQIPPSDPLQQFEQYQNHDQANYQNQGENNTPRNDSNPDRDQSYSFSEVGFLHIGDVIFQNIFLSYKGDAGPDQTFDKMSSADAELQARSATDDSRNSSVNLSKSDSMKLSRNSSKCGDRDFLFDDDSDQAREISKLPSFHKFRSCNSFYKDGDPMMEMQELRSDQFSTINLPQYNTSNLQSVVNCINIFEP